MLFRSTVFFLCGLSFYLNADNCIKFETNTFTKDELSATKERGKFFFEDAKKILQTMELLAIALISSKRVV